MSNGSWWPITAAWLATIQETSRQTRDDLITWLRVASRRDYFFIFTFAAADSTFYLLTLPSRLLFDYLSLSLVAERSISNRAFFHLQKNIGRPLHTFDLTAVAFRLPLRCCADTMKRHFYRKEIKFSNRVKRFSPQAKSYWILWNFLPVLTCSAYLVSFEVCSGIQVSNQSHIRKSIKINITISIEIFSLAITSSVPELVYHWGSVRKNSRTNTISSLV